ncbi:hypothetical protein CLOBOL_05837 [Enterocloster bolteae ATCC BAA-613]|uniref:Uncharacterized protein n=1 Tax=Enterocloster bolteae (strain ATCC BAA-613 / DSM 15670 / CCUG 46953 / JCM 12243 / WAL 16351) TaxID=411902 RepID=A8S128_ENTBW|nr:hypothetical protein CLOBOL_05837 [Enterocloster bolteae ATCC BAA-613]
MRTSIDTNSISEKNAAVNIENVVIITKRCCMVFKEIDKAIIMMLYWNE